MMHIVHELTQLSWTDILCFHKDEGCGHKANESKWSFVISLKPDKKRKFN